MGISWKGRSLFQIQTHRGQNYRRSKSKNRKQKSRKLSKSCPRRYNLREYIMRHNMTSLLRHKQHWPVLHIHHSCYMMNENEHFDGSCRNAWVILSDIQVVKNGFSFPKIEVPSQTLVIVLTTAWYLDFGIDVFCCGNFLFLGWSGNSVFGFVALPQFRSNTRSDSS